MRLHRNRTSQPKEKAAPGSPESGLLFCVFLLLEASVALVEPRLKNRFENPLIRLLGIIPEVRKLHDQVVELHKGKRQRIELRMSIRELFADHLSI